MEDSLKENIEKNIYESVNEYKKFEKVEGNFPEFFLEIDSTLPRAIPGQNCKINAYTKWDYGQTILYVPEKILDMPYKPFLFHEFTHIIDYAKWGAGDYEQIKAIRGYTEYHAYQIEILKYIGVDCTAIGDIKAKSVCGQYDANRIRNMCLNHIKGVSDDILKQLSQDDFPNGITELDSVLDLLFKYWGFRSVYKMFDGDYKLNIDESLSENIEKVFGDGDFNPIIMWNDTLYGFLDDDDIVQFKKDYAKFRNLVIKRF